MRHHKSMHVSENTNSYTHKHTYDVVKNYTYKGGKIGAPFSIIECEKMSNFEGNRIAKKMSKWVCASITTRREHSFIDEWDWRSCQS